MKLTDPKFDAKFYGKVVANKPNNMTEQGTCIEGAQGLLMLCPCGEGHSIEVPFANPRNAPQLPPEHGPLSRDKTTHYRWTMSGSGLDDLTITPSVDVGKESCWHGFITNGEVN